MNSDILRIGNMTFHVPSCLEMGFEEFKSCIVAHLPEKRQKEVWKELGGKLPTKKKEE